MKRYAKIVYRDERTLQPFFIEIEVESDIDAVRKAWANRKEFLTLLTITIQYQIDLENLD